jgi:hypothetical protein
MEATEISGATTLLRSRLGTLYAMAGELAKKHLEYVMAENKSRTWEEKSVLFCRARARDNAVTATWLEIKWYGSKALATRRMVQRGITKPKSGYGYRLEVLLKLAQPWEADMVREAERELTTIRREAQFVAKAIGLLNKASKTKGDKE